MQDGTYLMSAYPFVLGRIKTENGTGSICFARFVTKDDSPDMQLTHIYGHVGPVNSSAQSKLRKYISDAFPDIRLQ